MSSKAGLPRLPPLKKFRLRHPDTPQPAPCIALMTAVLGCWASNGQNSENCIKTEDALRVCMDTSKRLPPKKNPINYHLGRLYPRLAGPRKK